MSGVPSSHPRIDVIALVVSAGGLDALTAVLRDLPPELPAAVVVAQHLGGQASRLVAILDRRTALPVQWARDGEAIAAGRVTVCPPGSVLESCRTGPARCTRGAPRSRTGRSTGC